MQLASMWSISCNIRHLAHQQSQHTIHWSMLQERTIRHNWQANTPTRESAPHYHALKRMKARAVSAKKNFRPGAMAMSGWTRCVRAVRDTRVADDSTPGVNTTHRVVYCPPIAALLLLLALSVSYFKQTLWRCGQLWPYVGMGSMGTCLHRDCNAIGDAAKISPRALSTISSWSVGRSDDMILPSREDPQDLGKSEWDQKLGKIECVFSLYDKMRWEWDTVYLPRGLPNIYCALLILPPLPRYRRTPTVATYRYTWRPWSSEFGHALGGRDRVNSEMHSDAVTTRVWRCTCRLWSSEIGGALGGGRFRGRCDGSWDSIDCSTCDCGNVESWVNHPPRDEKLAGSGRLSILGWCWTRSQFMIMAWRVSEGWLNFGFYSDGRVEHKKVTDQRRWGKSSWETGT